MTRVVIDTSVYVSALIGKHGSAPDLVVRLFIEDKIEVVISPLLIAELERVLLRPKFGRYIDKKTPVDYIARIRRHARTSADPAEAPATSRDREDDYLIALARTEHADAIVSLDLDLLDAGLAAPPVWTPRQLVETLAN